MCNHSQERWINKVETWKRCVSSCSALLTLVFQSRGGRKVIFKSEIIIQTETQGSFLCVSTADLHLSVSGRPKAERSFSGNEKGQKLYI